MITDTDLAACIDRFADELHAQGDLIDPTWRQGLRTVLHNSFVPLAARAVPDYPGRGTYGIDRARDEAECLHAIHCDTSGVRRTLVR